MSASTTTGGKSRATQYTIIGVILAIAALALILWNHGLFDKTEDVATIGDHSVSEAEYNYYYGRLYESHAASARQTAEYYAALGATISGGFDTSLTPAEQWRDEASGVTYEEYFRVTAIDNLQRALILENHANSEGYTLSEAGQQQLQDILDNQHDQIVYYRAMSGGYGESTTIQMVYGDCVTKSLLKKLSTRAVLAEEYAQHISDSFTYTDEELEAYYNGESEDSVPNKDNLDSFSYHTTYIAVEFDTQEDEDGNALEPTTEETEAALADAQAQANAMRQRLEAGEDFEAVAKELAPETEESSDAEELSTLTDGLPGSSLSASTPYAAWLKAEGRTAGDVTIVENGTSGFYIVQFVDRQRDETAIEFVNTRLIYIEAETTLVEPEADDAATEEDASEPNEIVIDPSASEEPAEVYLPTEEQSAAAKTKADEILAQWESGEKTVDSFGALAKEHSAHADSAELDGVFENVTRGSLPEEFDDWAFGENPELGQPKIFESKDADGNILGYIVIYLEELGPVRWVHTAQEALRADSYDEWFAALQADYPITMNENFFTEVPDPVITPEEPMQDSQVAPDEPEVVAEEPDEADEPEAEEEDITNEEEPIADPDDIGASDE